MNSVTGPDIETIEFRITKRLKRLAKREKIDLEVTSPVEMFLDFINLLYDKYEDTKVAILIDEYDAPILDHLNDPDKADKIRLYLRDFYGVLKTSDSMIGHIFVTGISRFTQTSMFSKLNNLTDITFNEKYATICGLTEADLDDLARDYQDKTLAALIENANISPGSSRVDLKKLIEEWYDGYSWDGKSRVFNPWSVLTFFERAKIDDYWYRTGTPNFLIELTRSGRLDFDLSKELPPISESKNVIDKIDELDPTVLMFQAGYLTIKEELPNFGYPSNYSLTIPNREVRAAIAPLAFKLKPPTNALLASKSAIQTRDRLLALDSSGLEEAFGEYLSQYYYDDHIEEERYYQTLFKAAMFTANQRILTQEHTAHGRLDVHIETPNRDHYIVELKIYRETKPDNKPLVPPKDPEKATKLRQAMAPLAQQALKQIDEQYADRFKGDSGRLVKIAVVIARRSFVLVEIAALD
jgi:hypothetical protein